MLKIKFMSVDDTYEYVMDHYAPYSFEAERKRTDTYAVISIQDSVGGGFGVSFTENDFCKGVLTLIFDDAVKETEGAVLFDRAMAEKIIDFIDEYKAKINTLLIHCYAGQSRSRAVAAFAYKMLGADNKRFFENGNPNMYVYKMLEKVLFTKKIMNNKANW